MFRFRRPEKPAAFDEQASAAKKHVADLVSKGIRPGSKDFEDRWGVYKRHFSKAQHRKCAFCESLVTHIDTGDVEHYRPKAEITELPANPSKWGREIPETGNAEGRAPDTVSSWGYHFLAYEWDNYLFSCGRCNRAWKGNLFPVSTPRSANPPTPESVDSEGPLLLNPYDLPDPAEHLQLTSGVPGQIEPRGGSAHGRATIDTCHLDRPSLVIARREKATLLFLQIKELLRSIRAPTAATEKALEDIRQAGHPAHSYAGLVRATFEASMGMTWEEAFGPDSTSHPRAD